MQQPRERYDPAKLVCMTVLRAMFFEGKPLQPGTEFFMRADQVGFAEATLRCRITRPEDRALVYRQVVMA